MILCIKTLVLLSPHKAICKSQFLNSHTAFKCTVPVASPCIKNNGRDLKCNQVEVMTWPATTMGKYFTGSFDMRFDTTGCGINP